jgi:hypothetical protein
VERRRQRQMCIRDRDWAIRFNLPKKHEGYSLLYLM